MNSWENLAQAVIVQAAKDYRSAAIQHKKHPKRIVHILMMQDCEEFFLSDRFCLMTKLDGENLLKRIKEESL